MIILWWIACVGLLVFIAKIDLIESHPKYNFVFSFILIHVALTYGYSIIVLIFGFGKSNMSMNNRLSNNLSSRPQRNVLGQNSARITPFPPPEIKVLKSEPKSNDKFKN